MMAEEINSLLGAKGHKIISCHYQGDYTCPVCPYKTELKSNLGRHAKSHETTLNLSDEGTMEKLKAQPSTTDNYKCGYCNFTTKFKQNLSKHVATHRPSGNKLLLHSCDKCAFETKDKSSFKRHQLTHKKLEEVEHYKCSQCNFVTKHQSSMNSHILCIHNKDLIEKFQCLECDFTTHHKLSLKSHILTHRKPGEVPMYKCPECSYETKNKLFLPNHMKTHLSSVPCPVCQKMISQRGMPVHLKSHQSDDVKKKYKCKHCNYGTQYFGNMSRHLKIMHSNKKDVNYKQCPDCSFKTLENSRLKRHIKEMHSEEAPQFKCEHCEFKSKFNSCLKRHVETAHINTDPVTCPECHKQSANIYTLRIHMKLHKKENEIKIFQCVECSYKTRHSGAYKDHIKRLH